MASDSMVHDTEVEHEAHHAPHPSVGDYVRVASALSVLTAMEFSTYLIDFGRMHTPLLLVLMAIKFVLVAGWFMHLKFDTRLFTRLMGTGLVGAFVLYLIAYAAIHEIPLISG